MSGQVLELPSKGTRPAATVAQTRRKKHRRLYCRPPSRRRRPVWSARERYVVRRGDTLGKIAKKHGLTEDQLMEMNNIRNRAFIYEGQVLALAASARAKPPVEAEVPVATIAAVTEPPAEAEAVEPESEREAEEIGPALVPGTQAAASADPSDYTVKDNAVIVQAAETIGHYAEWLDVRASQLRQLNRMSMAHAGRDRPQSEAGFLQGHARPVRGAPRGISPSPAGSVLYAVPHPGHQRARHQAR